MEKLIKKIDRELKKSINSTANEIEISNESVNYMKKYFEMYEVCLLKICEKLKLF